MMDAEKIAAVFDMYVKRCSPNGTDINLDSETLRKEARRFLFSDESLLDPKELREYLDHLAYLHGDSGEGEPFIFAEDFPHDAKAPSLISIRRHVMAMFPKMYVFLEEDRLEKCLRWVGFAWGCGSFLEKSFFPAVYFEEKIARALAYRHYYAVEKRTDLSFAFLGMIQGMLWSSGVYSLQELKDHNKP
jgi:hypothetical protein